VGRKTWTEPLSHGREFTNEEVWENFTYSIKQVAPVAEENSVRIGIHPDDPPVPVLAGVPRCIFGNFQGYQRALEIAGSPNVGICLCCGTWLEGGKALTEKDPEQMIRYFGATKIWKIHFRNVSAARSLFTAASAIQRIVPILASTASRSSLLTEDRLGLRPLPDYYARC